MIFPAGLFSKWFIETSRQKADGIYQGEGELLEIPDLNCSNLPWIYGPWEKALCLWGYIIGEDYCFHAVLVWLPGGT